MFGSRLFVALECEFVVALPNSGRLKLSRLPTSGELEIEGCTQNCSLIRGSKTPSNRHNRAIEGVLYMDLPLVLSPLSSLPVCFSFSPAPSFSFHISSARRLESVVCANRSMFTVVRSTARSKPTPNSKTADVLANLLSKTLFGSGNDLYYYFSVKKKYYSY